MQKSVIPTIVMNDSISWFIQFKYQFPAIIACFFEFSPLVNFNTNLTNWNLTSDYIFKNLILESLDIDFEQIQNLTLVGWLDKRSWADLIIDFNKGMWEGVSWVIDPTINGFLGIANQWSFAFGLTFYDYLWIFILDNCELIVEQEGRRGRFFGIRR